MASITARPNGRFWIQWIDLNRQRQTLRPGKITRATAETIKGYVERLVECQAANVPIPVSVSAWLDGISDDLRSKMIACALLPHLKPVLVVTLDDLVERYLVSLKELSNGTRLVHENVVRVLTAHLGASVDIQTITEGDADGYRRHLAKRYAEATVAQHVKICKQLFRFAVRHKLLVVSPVADLKGGSQSNRERQVYVPAETILTLMETATPQWKAILALSRFAGFRTPSEQLRLKWSDVDFADKRLRVDAPKTGVRHCPMVREVEQVLLPLFENADEPDGYVITGYRNGSLNWRTNMMRALKRHGIQPWPRLFHNMRASCQTDMVARGVSLHAAARYLGNSAKIAEAHYMLLTDGDWQAALGKKG